MINLAFHNDPQLQAMLKKISDMIFENLPENQEVIKAPKCGANLSLVPWLFLLDTVERAVGLADAKMQAACEPALQVLRDKSVGKHVSEDVAYAAAYAARTVDADDATYAIATAAAYAAYAADTTYAADATYVGYAIDAAAYATTNPTAYAAERIKQRDTYIRLLEQAQ